MKVSLIVPIYNSEKYLSNLLSDLHKQTFKSVEFILVNDGSTDKSLLKINEILTNYSDLRFKVINKENGGVSSARNVGIRKSKGMYIMFMDADDRCDNNFVEEYYNKITLNNTDIEIFNVDIIKPNGEPGRGLRIKDPNLFKKKEVTSNELIKAFATQNIPGYSYAYISKRKLWDKVAFNEKIAFQEDNLALMTLVIKNNPVKIHINNEAYYKYIIYSHSASHTTSINIYWQAYQVDKILENMLSNEFDLSNNLKYMYGYELNSLSTVIRESLFQNRMKSYYKARRLYLRSFKKAYISNHLKIKRWGQYILLKLNLHFTLKKIYSKLIND